MKSNNSHSFMQSCYDKNILGIFFAGISAGISLGLVLSVLNIWLAKLSIDKSTIGAFSMLQLPYILRFLWAPCIDYMNVPWLTNKIGRRRSWLIMIQLFLLIATERLGAADPINNMSYVVFWAFMLSFGVATQDILLDVHRIEVLTVRKQAIGASSLVMGFRIGGVLTGGLLLILIDYCNDIFCYESRECSWYYAFLFSGIVAAMFTFIAMSLTNFADSKEKDTIASSEKLPFSKMMVKRLSEYVFTPFLVFMKGKNCIIVLSFILLYKFCDAFIYSMINPFFIDKGFSLTEIGIVIKTFGFFATFLGSVFGSFIAYRFGLMNALLFAGIAQTVSNLMYVWMDYVGHDIVSLYITVGLECFNGSMALSALLAYLSSICNKEHAATQYALLSSIAMIVRVLISPLAGLLADNVGWTMFFLFSFISGIPVILMLVFYYDDLKSAMTKHDEQS